MISRRPHSWLWLDAHTTRVTVTSLCPQLLKSNSGLRLAAIIRVTPKSRPFIDAKQHSTHLSSVHWDQTNQLAKIKPTVIERPLRNKSTRLASLPMWYMTADCSFRAFHVSQNNEGKENGERRGGIQISTVMPSFSCFCGSVRYLDSCVTIFSWKVKVNINGHKIKAAVITTVIVIARESTVLGSSPIFCRWP